MFKPNDYTVGWICALSTEYVAAQEFLDDEHDPPEFVSPNATNDYTLGRLGKHNVVIAVLPDGEYGTASAASVATNMLNSFPNVRIGLMVGIGGGAPSEKHDIRLGDIVVSAPRDGEGGAFQYDFGKTIQEQVFQHTRFLNQPPTILRTAVTGIQAQYKRKGHQLEEAIRLVLEKNPRLRQEYARPQPSTDRLFHSHAIHDSRGCVEFCAKDRTHLVERQGRAIYEDNPAIHYGLVASANQLMKDAVIRDRLAAEKDVLCFEMEAAGLMNHFPCLVIRGICDYSDSHKNKEWQGYAAMAAAAYAKDLLSRIPPNKVEAEKRISDIFLDFQNRLENVFENVKNVHTLVSTLARDTDHVVRNIDLEKLLVAEGAEYGTYMDQHEEECLPGTRMILLEDIKEWASSPEEKCIFWLNGLAGTGKSTISRTTAKLFHETGLLGASFFFKRGEGDRGNATRFFPTITRQLLTRIPELKPGVLEVLKDDPRISVKPLKEQFDKLFLQPLLGLENLSYQSARLVIVIDALDECDNDDDIKVILQILPRVLESKCVQLRIFVTSRPELPIRLGFKDISHRNLILHEIPDPIIKHDISLFLEYKLDAIRKERSLTPDWPGNTHIQALLTMSVPLFIFAATVCRLLQDHNLDPTECLTEILKYQNQESKLDGTYLPVFDRVLVNYNEEKKKKVAERIREVVGIIILLKSPLPVIALARLTGVTTTSIKSRLSSLHSVLNIPTDEITPVTLFHLSLRDFLLDPRTSEKCSFWVDKTKTHRMITMKCLGRMSECLQQNICSLENPGTLRTEIDSRIITQCLLPDVQYACRFWAYHLKESQTCISDNDLVHIFLRDHFLHWLESLSLLGRIAESINLVRTLQTVVKDKDTETCRFLDDAMRFIRKNISVIDQTPLQLYISALIFTPERSVIRNKYIDKIPTWIQKLPEVEAAWSAALQTLEGHSSWIWAVAFSPDGKLVASGSEDATVKLWDPATGTLRQTLGGHSDFDSVWGVAFSPDGKLVASGSGDKVKLWNPATGTLRQTLEGHSRLVRAVAFSPNSKLVASGSSDKTVKLWDLATGTLRQTLEGHSDFDSVWAVTFSPDGKLVASGSSNTVKLWDLATGTLQQTLKGHSDLVQTVAYSPDGKLVASGSSDKTVKLWDLATGTLRQTLEGHSDSDLVCAVIFSPNGKLVASGSGNKVELWDLATGTLQQTLKGHSDLVTTVAYSPDGKLVASGSYDATVKLWDPATSNLRQMLEGHSSRVRAVTFSPNGKLVASASYDATVKLWDPATGTLRQTLEGHSGQVQTLVFSPNSKLVASGSSDNTIKLWDSATGVLRQTLKGYSGRVQTPVFSPNSKVVAASGSRDNTVNLWDPVTGTLRQMLKGHSDLVQAVAFSPNSKLVASGSYDTTVKLWDPVTGTLRKTLKGHSSWVWAVTFSPNGKLVASGSSDDTVKLWDSATGILRQTLKGHSNWVRAVAFSPDGKLVASGSTDKTVKLWDPATGTLRQTLKGHSGSLWELAFSSDGKLLRTNKGQFSVGSFHISSQSQTASSPCKNILVKNEWLTRNDHNAIWLPIEYRATASAVYDSMLVMGHASGRVTFLMLI